MMQVFGGYWQLQEAPAHTVQLMVEVWQAELRAERELNRRSEEEYERKSREVGS